MHKILLIVFFLLNVPVSKPAIHKPAEPPAQKELHHLLKSDTGKIDKRSFNTAAIKSYRNKPEFKYSDKGQLGESAWDRFWRSFWDWIASLFKSKKQNSLQPAAFVKYIAIGLLALGLIYAIIKIIGVENIFSRDPKPATIPYSESLENIHKISFEEEIEAAVSAGSYRLAVRLLYLRCLKQLNDARLINWEINKTNTEYLNEITNGEQKQSFKVLTQQFEYIWYGDFPIDGARFQNINAVFQDFKQGMA